MSPTHTGVLHIPIIEALMGPVVVAMDNMVGRIELLSWLKSIVPHIPAGEVRVAEPSDLGRGRLCYEV